MFTKLRCSWGWFHLRRWEHICPKRLSVWNQFTPIQSFLFVSGLKATCDHSQMHKLSSTAESLQEKWEIMCQIFLQLHLSMETCTHILTAQKGLVLKEKLPISFPHKANSLWLITLCDFHSCSPWLHARFKGRNPFRDSFYFAVLDNPHWFFEHKSWWVTLESLLSAQA